MNIAVCLSGESRTWEKCVPNIKKFFEYNIADEIHYFGHTRNINSWKLFDEEHNGGYVYEHLDKDALYAQLNDAYKFTGLIVDKPYVARFDLNHQEIRKNKETPFELACNYVLPWTWNSMSYSCMMSNFQKQKYELVNDMKFDIVVRARFDQCFDPQSTLDTYLGDKIRSNNFRNDVLYCEATHFPHDFMQQSINDVFYFGSSRVMDIVETFYRIYHNGDFFRLIDANYYDGAMKTTGYGPLLYKWLVLKNIYPYHLGLIAAQILRQDSKVQDTIVEFETMQREAQEWGRKI